MSDFVKIPRTEWLQTLLRKHIPVRRDIGDQRDPYEVTVCSCDPDGYKTARGLGYSKDGNLYYPMHLYEVLEKDYYNRLDLDSMR